ncbi:RNA-binding protein rnc1 [Spathaspora sp. JA1]|nr:RNA-binding protein rnc1 [Spathaspora sp. JA1]
MTESLFDTNFTSENEPKAVEEQAKSVVELTSGVAQVTITDVPEPQASESNESSQEDSAPASSSSTHDQSTSLPSLDDKFNGDAVINVRVLVSAKEAGCLIGQNGQVIDSIRAETNTKAGISKLQPGSHERILTVSGKLDSCAKALSYFAQALCNSAIETYNYFPLKQLSANPCIENETTILRLLVPNAQMGTLIGSKGLRIQQIQSNYHISMIASKSFLPGSNERLVELQGTVNDLYDALRIIARCLIEDISALGNTNYYVPRGHHSQYNGGGSNGDNSSTPTNGRNFPRRSSNITTTSLSFPNDIVGALIGKNGSRIQGVRKVSGATIGISEEVEGKDERIFTISGSPHAVEKAKGLLYHNLQREEQRRAEAEAEKSE